MTPWWERRSLRFRLALWYALGGTVLLALFSATLYLYVSEWMGRPLDHDLRRDLARVQRHLSVTPAGQVKWNGQDVTDWASWPPQNPWFEVWDERGHLVQRVWPFSDNRVEVPLAAPVAGRETISVFNVAQDLRLRVLSVPYHVPGRKTDWMIRIMRVHEPVADALSALRLIILVALPVVIALLVIGGYVLTRRWLAPLDAMVGEANKITAENFDRRLPVPNPHDELGRLASVFNVTLDRLENSYTTLNRFVADASHELRTPLTTLRSVGEIGIRSGRTADEYRDIIGSMLEEAQRLQLLIQRLLELATAEAGRIALQRSEIRVDDFVRTCVSELAILAESKGQRIVVDAMPATAVTDPLLLRQATQNLIDNAIKYGPDGSTIRVTVRASTTDVEIAVIDEGPGISPEHRANIAQRFYRPDPGRDRGQGGFGLGLSLTKAYMGVLGGALSFAAGAPTGSIFILQLPTSIERATP